jgi:DNA-binding winged helix-turn-helix (wHTH) protein
MSLRFCGCTLDVEARRLFRGREEVRLSPRAFETLRTLVERRPRALSKGELLGHVWPDVFVSEVSLARVVNEIRQRLGDGREGRIIRTIHSHGYAFVAEIEDEDALSRQQPETVRRQPVCWLISATRTLPLQEGAQIIGRDPTVELYLDSPKVSRRHARIEVKRTQATIEDLGSKNGSFVRDTRIEVPTALHDGDEVQIGRFKFVFRPAEPTTSTETEA